MKEFLRKQKAEVMKVSLYEYDAAKHDRTLLSEGIEIGKKEGMQQGKRDLTAALVRKKLEKGHSIEQIAEALEETPAYIMKIKEGLDNQ